MMRSKKEDEQSGDELKGKEELPEEEVDISFEEVAAMVRAAKEQANQSEE
jgi:hypothetical protein